MRGSVGETLERLILLQIGAAAATRDRVQEVVESLIEQGRVEREEGRTLVNDVMSRARERSSGARSLIDASMQQSLRGAGVPTREDYEDLIFRVEQLEHRMRMLEDRPVPPPPRAGGPEAPPPPGHPPTPPMAGSSEPPPRGTAPTHSPLADAADEEKPPRRDTPETPPGL